MKTKIQMLIWTLALAGVIYHPQTGRGATLVHYWPFDEIAGASVSSNRVSTNLAVLVNADTNTVWISSGLAPQLTNSTAAINLDGVNDYVNMGVLGLNGSATLSMWLNVNSTFIGDMRLVSALTEITTYEGLLRFDSLASGNIQVISSVPSIWGNAWQTLAPVSSVSEGQWFHLAVVYSGGTATLYLNGERKGANYSGFQFDISQFGLGAKFNNLGNTFSGAIDDMSVWNGPLNTNSIAQLAAGVSPTNIVDTPIPLQPAHLVHYFPLDEAPGATTVPNSASGGNTGTLVGFDPAAAWTNAVPTQLSSSTRSLTFDGVDDYVNFGNLGLFGSATVSLWIKPTTNNADIRIYSQLAGPTTTPGLIGFVGTGGLQVYNSAATVRIAPDDSIPTNQWTHVVVSYKNGFATAFINGVPQISTRAVFSFASANFGLGANFNLSFGRKFSGLIDDVSIWDNALSLNSIQQLASGVSPTAITDTAQPLPTISLGLSFTNPPPAVLRQYFPLEGPDNSTNVANLSGTNAAYIVNYVAPPPPWTNSGLASQLTNNVSALVVDGGTTYGNLGNIGLSGTGTISLWAKPASLTGPAGGSFLFSQLTGASSLQGAVSVSATGGLIVRGGTGAVATNGTLKIGEWIHLVFVYNAGSMITYSNGVSISTVGVNFQFDVDPIGIGATLWHLSAPFGAPFNGQLDDFAIWNVPLSAEEIQNLTLGQSPLETPSSASLVQYFPLNGTGTNSVIANAVLSGNTGQIFNYSPTVRSWDSLEIPSALTSRSTRSLFLDGFNDYVNLRNIVQSGSGTVSFWANISLLPGETRLFSQLTGATTQPGTATVRTNGEVWIWNGTAWQVAASANTLTTNRWYHLALTYASGVATLYVDGVAKNPVVAGFNFSPAEFGLGAKFIAQNGNTFAGYMDDVSIWNSALSPDTVLKLAAGTVPTAVTDTPRSLALTYPAYPGGAFRLETSTSITGPWIVVPGAPTLGGIDYTVLVPIASGVPTRFYRLKAL